MTYQFCKIIIDNRDFEPFDMIEKLDMFLSCGKINTDQHAELIGKINA